MILGFFFLALSGAIAQDDPEKNAIIEQRIETIAEQNEEEELDYTTLFDDLSHFFDHPIDLNHSSKEELLQLRLLDEFQIDALLSHIEKNGKLISVYELQSIKGFDALTIRNVLPFVVVNRDLNAPTISFRDMLKNGGNELFIRYSRILEEQEGFSDIEDSVLAENPNRRFLGDQNKVYTRYRFKYRTNVSWGLTAEKDAGEEFFSGSQSNGFDFYSAHFFLRDFGKLKALAIGDYHAQFGQGLTFWSGLAFGKSSDVMAMKRNAVGLRPYTAVDENLFMRGGGATVGLGKFELTAFYSNKNIDANISDADTIDNEVLITSFQNTGIHGTPGELMDKDAIQETYYGGNFAYKSRRLSVGVTAAHGEYGGNLQRNLSFYNQFDFNSNSNTVVGADYNFLLGNFNFFGEVSRSANGGIAYLNGALVSLDPRLAISLFQRNYQRDYQSVYSSALAESSRNVNEKGLFFGITAKPHKYVTILGYFDRFEFPWLRFQVDAPSQGHEYLIQANYRPSRKIELYARIRHRDRPRNTEVDLDDIDFIDRRIQTNYRFNVTYKVNEAFRFRNRVEFSTYAVGDQEPEKGYLAYQDIIYKPVGSKLQLTFRYALFETATYDARIYAYENDVLYFFSIPAYYNRGTRTYLVARYKIGRKIDVWLRYGQWFYNDRNVIGSGLNEIQGNTRSEIRAQVRFKF